MRIAGHHLDPATRLGDQLRRLKRGMIAGLVIDQHGRAGALIAGQDVPGRDDQIVAFGQKAGCRQSAGGNHHDVRGFTKHIRYFRPGVEAELPPPAECIAPCASR